MRNGKYLSVPENHSTALVNRMVFTPHAGVMFSIVASWAYAPSSSARRCSTHTDYGGCGTTLPRSCHRLQPPVCGHVKPTLNVCPQVE